MNITYSLSNRQRKELLVRAVPLQIALPIIDEPDDLVEFAKRSMPEDAEWIKSAELGDVFCVHAPGAGLAGMLGRIADPDEAIDDGRIPLCVAVVLVQLAPPKPRAKPMHVAWPGRGYVNGVEYSYAPRGAGEIDAQEES